MSASPLAPTRTVAVSDSDIKRITDNLRQVGLNRPTRVVALRRLLKSLLAGETGDALIEMTLGKLVAAGTVVVTSGSEVKNPLFDSAARATARAP